MNKLRRVSLNLDMTFVEVDVFDGLSDRALGLVWINYKFTQYYFMDDYGNSIEQDCWVGLLQEW